MDQGQKADVTMGDNDPTVRPRVRDLMGNEAISNLEKVLAMNSYTIQHTIPQGMLKEEPSAEGFKPLDIANGQYNAYLYNSLMQSFAAQSAQQTQPLEFQSPPQPHPVTEQQQQTLPGFPPYIQYPFLPFWTACPLPFSPLAYPQIIIPPVATPQPIGPQILRPVQMSLPSSPVQQMSMHPNFPINKQHDYQPIRPKVTDSKEEKLNRYKEKRCKRQWTRLPDQRLSQMAQERPRDQSGKFVSTKSTIERDKELKDLRAELSQVKQKLSSTELELTRLKRDLTNDDMYQRQVAQCHLNSQAMQVPPQGVIYSPFRGGNTAVEAFKEKIDFKEQKTALKKINSPYLSEIEKQQLEWQRQQGLKNAQPVYMQTEMDKPWSNEQTFTDKQQDGWVEELLNTASSSDDEDMNLG